MGSDGHLHIISLDGKIDLTDQILRDLTANGSSISSAGFSRDGHMFAYSGDHGLVVIDVTERVGTHRVTDVGGHEVAWSPDGSQIALGDGDGVVCVAHISGGPCAISAPQQQVQLTNMIGWVDESHLALRFLPPPSAAPDSIPTTGIGVLDVSSWAFRVVATFSGDDLGSSFFNLSPDGKEALYFNKRFRNDPYTPMVKEIDLATGAITSLPHLADVMGPYSGFTSLAWRPDTQMMAASTGFGVNGDLKTWLLDLQHDTAIPLRLPEARYVGGWAPDGGHLILTSGWQFAVNWGPYEIDAAIVQADGQATSTALTKTAITFPYIGFVRTT